MVKYCRRRGGGGGGPTPKKFPKLPCLGKLFRFRGGGPDPRRAFTGPLVLWFSLRVARRNISIGILLDLSIHRKGARSRSVSVCRLAS